jgi:signal transduction histidine kinase
MEGVKHIRPEAANLADDEIRVHDGAIQNLFGLSLQVEHGLHLFGESPDEARAVLARAIRGLHTLIGDLRHRVEELAAHDSGHPAN